MSCSPFGIGHALDDKLTLDLEKDVIGGERTHGFHWRWFGEVGEGYGCDWLLTFGHLASYAGGIVSGEAVLRHVLESVELRIHTGVDDRWNWTVWGMAMTDFAESGIREYYTK